MIKSITYDDTLWQLVPKEPTREIDQAFYPSILRHGKRNLYPVWKDLLSAAPTPPAQQTDEKGRPMTFWGGLATPPAQPAETTANVGCLVGFQFDIEPSILPVSLEIEPAQTAERKPLTRYAINELMKDCGWQNSAIRQADLDGCERLVRAIEAAHGIKGES